VASEPLVLTVPQLLQFYAPLAGLLLVVFWLGVLSQRVKSAEEKIQRMEEAEGEGGVVERMVRLEVHSENILKQQEIQTREMAGVQRQLANMLRAAPRTFETGGD
jgi:hypothetical protein